MFDNFGITRYTIYNFVTKLLTTALVRVIHSYHEDTYKRFWNSLILHRVFSFWKKPMIKLLKFIRTNWITHTNTRNHTYRQIKRKTWQFAVGAQLQLTNASWETMMHDDNFCVGDAMTLRRPWRFYDVAGDLVTTVKSQWCRRRPCDDREESMMSQSTLTNPRCRWRGPVTVAFQEGHGSDEAWSQSRNKTIVNLFKTLWWIIDQYTNLVFTSLPSLPHIL